MDVAKRQLKTLQEQIDKAKNTQSEMVQKNSKKKVTLLKDSKSIKEQLITCFSG